MHSHYGWERLKRLQVRHVTELLKKALEKSEEDRAWSVWVQRYAYVEIGWLKFIPFSEFHKKLTIPTKIETKEEILSKVYNIMNMKI